MSDDETIRVKHILSTIRGLQDWLGHVHSALSSLDPEMDLRVDPRNALHGNGGENKKGGVCAAADIDKHT